MVTGQIRIGGLLCAFKFTVLQNKRLYPLIWKDLWLTPRCSFWKHVPFLYRAHDLTPSSVPVSGSVKAQCSQRQLRPRTLPERSCQSRWCLLSWGRPWSCCHHCRRPRTSHSLGQMLPLKGSPPAPRQHASFSGSFVTRQHLGPRKPWDNCGSSVSSGCGQRCTPRSRS